MAPRPSLLAGEAARATKPRLGDDERSTPPAAPVAEPKATAAKAGSRAGLKHIGGYLDDAAVEKVALLRARLKLDNSQLIERAIEDLFAAERAKRAF